MSTMILPTSAASVQPGRLLGPRQLADVVLRLAASPADWIAHYTRAAARAGLSAAVSAHWLRHAHVSHALDRGAPAHLVQATVGHANLSTTSKYAHARPSDSSSRYLPG